MTNQQPVDRFQRLSQLEGIIPALETLCLQLPGSPHMEPAITAGLLALNGLFMEHRRVRQSAQYPALPN